METNIIKISKSLKTLKSDIAEDSAIYNWIADIKKAFLINSNITDWNLVGKAVVLEAQEEDDVHETLDLVAKTLNMSLIKIEMPNLINNFKEWSNNISYIQPAIIYLEPGIWHGNEFKDTSENSQYLEFEKEEIIEFRSNLIDLIRNKFQEKPLIIVTSVKEFTQLDTSFRCEGLFDRRIEVPKWTDEKIFNQFISNIGKEKFSESILTNRTKVAALIRATYPDKRRRLLTEKALKRVAWRENRLIEYHDLLVFATYGTGEFRIPAQTKSERYRHAVHEAGHAVVEHLCSRDKTAPALCSILPSSDMHGVVVPDYDSIGRIGTDLSFLDIKNKISALLAGRAAEHLILGFEEVSANGASRDLEHASYLAKKIIAENGFYLDKKNNIDLSKNLMVVMGKESSRKKRWIDSIARRFLESVYKDTIKILEKNKSYLENVINELIKNNFLLATDLIKIYETQKPKRIVN